MILVRQNGFDETEENPNNNSTFWRQHIEQTQLVYFIFVGKHMSLRANVLTTCRVALIAHGNLLEPSEKFGSLVQLCSCKNVNYG